MRTHTLASLVPGVQPGCHVSFPVIPDSAEQNGFRHLENVPTNARVCSVAPRGWTQHFRHVWYFVAVKYKLVTEKQAAVGVCHPNLLSLFLVRENLAFLITTVASAALLF